MGVYPPFRFFGCVFFLIQRGSTAQIGRSATNVLRRHEKRHPTTIIIIPTRAHNNVMVGRKKFYRPRQVVRWSQSPPPPPPPLIQYYIRIRVRTSPKNDIASACVLQRVSRNIILYALQPLWRRFLPTTFAGRVGEVGEGAPKAFRPY